MGKFFASSSIALQNGAIVEGFATETVLQIAGDVEVQEVGGDEDFWSLLLRIFWVGGEESLVLSCKRDKNRYIIQGFAERRMCREMQNSEGDENEKKFSKV
ncbi:hypothetical protein [Acidovorax sp. LjRoot194]|uniref:hypothetical protein n=1 Tax=Acidovorax sp. LjRoot194 TaxID=3342280 RepID=UPI003ECCB84C